MIIEEQTIPYKFTRQIKGIIASRDRLNVIISQALNVIVILITGKLIAVFISPEDFGRYNLQFAAFTLFSTLLISPFLQFTKATNNTILRKVGTRKYLISLFSLAFLVFCLVIGFFRLYFGEVSVHLIIVLLTFSIISPLSNLFSDFFTTKNLLSTYAKFSLIKPIIGMLLLLSIFFIVRLDIDHTILLWYVQLLGTIGALIFFLKDYSFFKAKLKIGYDTYFKKYLKFAWPLILMGVCTWANNYFDRYALEILVSVREVGIYNANYALGSKMFLSMSPIFAAFLTPIAFANKSLQNKKKDFRPYLRIYIAFSILILAILFFTTDWLGSLFLSENYKDGFALIFWIALAFFILTLTQFFELILYSEQRTKLIFMGHLISAAVNILLNVLFIPSYGILGAAFATCIAFTVHLIIVKIGCKFLENICPT